MTTTLKNNEYIVFQPDQVLTNDHLNQLFYYLDRQNRLTRSKLIGMGIVCGFELEVTLNGSTVSVIQIDKGCGITSQGYLISDCNDKKYCYATPYVPPPLPQDLPFCCNGKTTNAPGNTNSNNCNIPFYNSSDPKQNCQGIYKLVTGEEYTTIVENPGSPRPQTQPCPPTAVTPAPPPATSPGNNDQVLPVPLSSMDWSGYNVVLFLEAKEKDLKNCDMQDCNNGGEKIVFHIRPLLVPKTCLTNNCTDKTGNLKAPEIKLKRFAVRTTDPANDISNGPVIFKTFQNIFNGASPNVLSQLGTAYGFCYAKYNSVLPSGSNSFTSLATDLQNISTSVQNTYLVQYFYDYVNDLILAYYEFRKIADKINVQCCADECAFPLHLVLGDATKSTSEFVKDCWRTYFIYSPIFDGENKTNAKLRFYYHRMEILATQFASIGFITPATDVKEPIKITPGEYEEFPLSQRAIPYYYNVTDTANPQNSLYQYWDFEKAAEGASAFNQSYNAGQYNSDPLVNTPLLFDIEKNNFFRIEGHIGLPYPQALLNILEQKQVYNLPFNVVAVAAEEFFITPLDLQIILACLKNLITEFESLLIEFLCKVMLCTKRLAAVKYSIAGANASALQTDTSNVNAEEFLKSFQFGNSVYKMGDFIRFVNPGEGTMGQAYTDLLQKSQYTNLVDIKDLSCDNLDLNKTYYTGFNVLNASDSLFYTLLNTKPRELQSSVLETQFSEFTTQFALLKTQISDGKSQVFSTALLDDCCDCLQCLYIEILWLLKQIVERIQEYESEMIFANYFKKHPGLEHKAGVPKGGTFVLVYSKANLAPQPIILIERLNSGLSTNTFVAPNNPVVIADFYIPYLCCNDCAPVVYVLPTTNQSPTISVKDNICSNEPPVAIQVSPVDTSGIVSAQGPIMNAIVKNADGTWALDPSKVDIGQQLQLSDQLTYALNGQTSSAATVMVYRFPDATFKADIIQSNPAGTVGGFSLVLTSVETDDSMLQYAWTLTWDTGLITNYTGRTQQIPLQNATGVSVTLQVMNGNQTCINKSTQDIPLQIAMDTQYCSDAAPIQIPVDPASIVSSVVFANAISKHADDGNWWFDPSQVNLQGNLQVSGTIISQFNGINSEPLTITVYQHPDAGFTVTVIPHPANPTAATPGMLTLNANEPNLIYAWSVSFTDAKDPLGTKPDTTSQIFAAQFFNSKQATVVLQVTNGPCVAKSKRDVINLTEAQQGVKETLIKKAATKKAVAKKTIKSASKRKSKK